MLTQFEQEHHPDVTQTLEGTVVSVTPESIFVDIGRKMDGVLPSERFRDGSGQITLKPGAHVRVTVKGREQDGSYQLSTTNVEQPKDWSGLERAFAEGLPISGTVTELVKGGLRVDVGARAFMPASRSGAREQGDLEKLVGQEIQCKIIKLDTAAEDVVVDRRVVLEQEEAQARKKAVSELREGAVMKGTVRSLTDFGAFVELAPGVDGLLHVADMAWHRVAKPSDFLKAGDPVEVKILKLNLDTRRISLGMKQLQPDPWTLAAEQFQVGDRVQGKVSRLTDFGAFIELVPGVDGLIHVTELSWSKKIRKASDVLKAGENVEAVVLGVNAAERRISLGLKQALGDPWEEAERKFVPGSVVEGPVTSLAQFGAFIDLGGGIEGMIHIGDISAEKRLNHPREMLATGKTVRAQVLEFDRAKRRIRLGMKQLEPTSADQYIAEHAPGDTVSGRLVEVSGSRARVELGEGVFAECRMPTEKKAAPPPVPEPGRADLSSMTAMLSAKWKQGPAAGAQASEEARSGQIRSFRILSLDAAKKRIELELAG
ncbi:MAG: S1 RNA-binding domain-containing protein [Acidobacteriota bacterium]|nr:S1 RNA-binding domain-containing protein [Acidobacteriota bacterium]